MLASCSSFLSPNINFSQALKDGEDAIDAETNFDVSNYEDEYEYLSSLSEGELVIELNKGNSPQPASDKRIQTSRPQSPATPDLSMDDSQPVDHTRYSLHYSRRGGNLMGPRGVLKSRVFKNRRCRRGPVRYGVALV